jgi:hypothetical protein
VDDLWVVLAVSSVDVVRKLGRQLAQKPGVGRSLGALFCDVQHSLPEDFYTNLFVSYLM